MARPAVENHATARAYGRCGCTFRSASCGASRNHASLRQQVPQRARHRKTDRLDLVKLMALLVRYVGGERGVWSVVRVPDLLS